MEFQFGEKEENLRKEIREFVKQELPPGHIGWRFSDENSAKEWEFALSISKKLSEKGWLTMNWPKEYGGMDASLWEQAVYREEVGYWGIPGTSMGTGGVAWVGPSLILFGTEEQKKTYMPQIAAGEPDGIWCTGYSEPDAGSDFAALRTHAERRGDSYVINGQKVWTSSAHKARWCWLAVRTEKNVKKKHHGISIIIVDMKSEGVTVRPIKNYVGFHYFNEVFFEDVVVPGENLVGEENKGWYQLMQSLSYERGSVGVGVYGSYKRILDELIHYCKESQLFRDPKIRHMLVDTVASLETIKLFAYETIWKMTKGVTPIYEPSRDKAYNDGISEKLALLGTKIMGAYSQLDPLRKDSKWTRLAAIVESLYWTFIGLSIAAGTTDTQRNIIGQFGLDLPKSY